MSEIKIEDMDELEIESYIKQCEQIIVDKRLQSLIALDPEHEICVNVKSLEYRLKEERIVRSITDLTKAWEDRLSNVVFDPLRPEEIDIAFPELAKWLEAKEKAAAEEAKAEAAKPSI
jgi:hypothetical protein